MTQKIKRALSLLLTVVLCFTTFSGLATTAYAAGEQGTAYLISFPRDGDEAYSGEWGHDELTFMNGWKTGKGRYTTVYAMNSYTGNICYCIEPGAPLQTGNILGQKGENFWEQYPSDYNKTISPETIKLMIGRIFQYGYTGTISTSWRSQNEGTENLSYAVATQLLIWETVVGERDADFNKVSTGGKNAILDQISSAHPLRDKIMLYYHRIEQSVQNHVKLPSFLSDSKDSAQTTTLTWDGSKYTATITDKNNVLADYSFSADNANVRLSVDGNKLIITATEAPTGSVGITAERRNSQRRGIITWTDATYGPDSSIQDLVTFSETVSDTLRGYLNVKVSYGSAKIVKTSEDGKVEGISFTIEGNGVNKTVQTGPNGEIQIDNLTPGIFTVTEQNYDRYEPQQSQRVTVVAGQTATVTFNNTLKRGSLEIVKTSEDGLNEGVTFHLFGTSLSGLAVDEYAVSNSAGVARFENVLIGTDYVLEEVNTAIRYVVPEKQSAAIEWNEVTHKSFHNVLKKFRVTVTKSDSEAGTEQGDASLAGATYGIYQGNTLIDSYTTDKRGQFTTSFYNCGDDWTIRELSPSEGYLLNPTVYKVGAEPELYTIEYNDTAIDATEEIIKGNIALIKHTDNGETGIETPEAGAEFQIYLKSAGSYEAAKESERDVLVCDTNGFCQSKDLPYGIYTVHQTVGWPGRELIDDFDVYIAQDAQTYHYILNNRNFESYIKIVKVDAETGKAIPYAGAGFQLYRPDGSLITQSFTYPEPTEIDTFYTNADGVLYTPEPLEYGTGFSLVECFAPYGYVLNTDPVYFDVTPESAAEEGGITIVEVTKPNMAQKGIIKINKTGEVFASVVQTENLYKPVYAEQGVSGAVFEITALEDVFTLDGTLRYAAGEVVDTVTVDETGSGQSKPLYLGKFEIREIKFPYGMIDTGAEPQVVELTYAGQEIEITETSASFYNERQKVKVTLDKLLEQDELFRLGMNGEQAAITFGLFAAETLTAADGTQIPADGLIEILSLGEDCSAICQTDLPFGSFYLKELSTDCHYRLNGEIFPFTFDYAGASVPVVEIQVNEGNAIENTLIRGEIHGMKTDENGNGLAGAVIGLFRPDETEFTEETALLTTISTEGGSFHFEGVPFGNWQLKELQGVTGFVFSDEVISISIGEDGAVVEIDLENQRIYGNLRLTKVDKDYPDNTLSGAEFEVYRDSNENKELDKDDVLLGVMEETSPGVYEMLHVEYGGVFVKESKAPAAFQLDENAYYVEIAENGKTYEVETEAGKGFINAAQTGNLHILKTSDDNVLQGFTFKVEGTDATGRQFYKEYVTDEKGEIHIELRVGEYTISELSNEATEKYILPDAATVTVEADSTASVEFHNKLKPTPPPTDSPQTGDNSHIGLFAALAAASFGSLCVLTAVRRHRKKSNNR